MIAPLSKVDASHLIAETKLIDLDDDLDSGSDYYRYELSLKKGGRNNPRHVHSEIKVRNRSSAARDEDQSNNMKVFLNSKIHMGKFPTVFSAPLYQLPRMNSRQLTNKGVGM